MTHDPTPIDEHTLAAFLAGRLSEARRAEVIAYLAGNADARELLCMAQDALEAAHAPVSEIAPPAALPHDQPLPADRSQQDRAPRRSTSRRAVLVKVAMAACVVLLVGLGLFAANPALRTVFRGAPDTYRGAPAVEGAALRVDIKTTPELVFQWNEIADAYYYRLVIIDTERVDVVDQHETRNARLGNDDAFVRSLDAKLIPGRTYSLTVDAFDVQDRTLQSSPPTRFTAPN